MDEEAVMDKEVVMDVDVYMKRIGYNGSREPTAETLFQLVAKHQLAVPFENIDFFEGKKKVLELSNLFSKIAIGHRGGFCYEVHGLFCWMLRELGFTVKMVASDFFQLKTQEWNLPCAHMLLLVYIGDVCYFTDLVWGGPVEPFQPIELKDGNISQQVNGTYSLEKEGDFWIVKMRDRSLKGHHRGKDVNIVGESWTVVLRFDTEERQLGDFQKTLDRIQFDKSADIVTNIPIVLIKKENGRSADMLVGRRYTHIKFQDGAELRTNKLNLEDLEIKDLLNQKFGIKIKKTIVFEEVSLGPSQTGFE